MTDLLLFGILVGVVLVNWDRIQRADAKYKPQFKRIRKLFINLWAKVKK